MISLILLAGGKGLRMGTALPKQFLTLHKKPIAHYSLEAFLSYPEIQEVVVVCDPAYRHFFSSYPVKFALPGERRQDSVYHGFQMTSEHSHWLCIHDAARPFVEHKMIERLIGEGKKVGAATVGMPIKYTVKLAKEPLLVDYTLNREQVWEIQTPQFLRRDILHQGFQIAHERQLTVTDDVAFAELLAHPVKLVEGSHSNLKITTREDLIVAEQLLTQHFNDKI